MSSTIGNYIQSGTLPKQLRKDIDNMFNATLETAPDDVGKIFKTKEAVSSNRYTRAEIAGFGLPSEISEGGVAPYDVPEEGFEKSYFFHEYGLGYVVTEWMLEDEQYGRIKQMPSALAKSIMVFKNYDCIDLLNNGETSSDKYYAKDGVALFGTHTLLDKRFGSATTLTNKTASNTDLAETPFEAAFQYFDDMIDENGYPYQMTPNKLIVSSDDRRVANRLLTQTYGSSINHAGLGYWGSTAPTSGVTPGSTMLNQLNPSNPGSVAAYDVLVSRYLEAGRWFLQAPEHEMTIMWKRAPKQESWFDKKTHNTIYQTRMRYSVFAEDYRGIYGNSYSD
jgi:hypothetical protein